MSKTFHHYIQKHSFVIYASLWLFWLAALTTYAVTIADIQTHIDRIAWVYKDVDGMNERYDRIARDQGLSDVSLSEYFLGISLLHRTVADYHSRIADYADQRVRDAWGDVPTNPWDTNTWRTNPWDTDTWSVLEPIGNQHLQVQFYGIPFWANGKWTVTRWQKYDWYYGLSNKISEQWPFLCKAWYSTIKDKTRWREINFNTDGWISNTSTTRSNDLSMTIDFANDVTEMIYKVNCSGTMGGAWKTLENSGTLIVVAPARAVVSSFRVSDTNPAPNESLTFTWETTGAVGCALIQLADGGVRFSLPGQVANGTFIRNADGSGRSTYRLICTNAIGEDSSASDIDVAVQTPGTGGDTPTPPSCGTAKDQSFTSAPNTNLCTVWAPSPSPAAVDPANANKWKWTCSLGSQLTTCSANKTSTNQTGATNTVQCGTASNSSFSTAPTYNLCIQSTNPSAPTLNASTNKWNWTCGTGTNSVSCSANYTTVSAVTCGTSNNGSFASAPTTNLCIQSTANPAVPSLNTTTNKWMWNCSSGAQNITCSANKTTSPPQTDPNAPKCGAVNNGVYINAPTTYLCDTGTAQPTVPTLDTATNKWKWSCSGSGQTVDCSARKWDLGTQLWQFAFSPQCADEDKFISLGGMVATYGTSSISTNYSPERICKIPPNTPSNIFSFLTELVDPVDTIGTDGTYNWKCKGISQNGVVDNGGAVTCQAQKLEDAECGAYANVARTAFDELSPGIRWGPVPTALNKSYCNVGTAMHENGSVALDASDFWFFHWECRSKDFFVKYCKAPYQQSQTINFSASNITPTAGQTVTFNWSLPKNTAFVKCYPVYDYRAQANAVYDFYNGSKALQWSFTVPIDKNMLVSLYCSWKSNDISAQKDISIVVATWTPAAIACQGDSLNGVKSPDNQNTCNFAWWRTDAGKPVSSVTTTGNWTLTGKCGNDGTWVEWSMKCPNKSAVITCPAGGATFYSNDGSNRCDASLVQKNAWQSVSIWNGLTILTTWPAATGSAACKADGTWNYIVNCPSKDVAVKTCPGGVVDIPSPNGLKTCVASWGITPANSGARATVTNGGTLVASCNANGDWDEASVRSSCPN